MTDRPLAGRHAFVTGGSRGIGRAIVTALAQAGAAVSFTYCNEKSNADALVAELATHDLQAHGVRMDVRDRASVHKALEQATGRFGGLRVLINNAGINKPTDFDNITDADWDDILGVNLKGPFVVTQEAFPHLIRAGGGAVVMIGSVSGQYGGPRTAHYAASKAGLISLGQVIARFGAKHNVRCNTLSAGLIQSEMATQGMASPAVQAAAQSIPLGRLGAPEEVADAVVFLASDAARYITAQTLNVNGGLYF